MPKKLRSIIITFCVGLVALGAYFIADNIIKNQEDPTSTKVTLIQYDTSSIASVKVTLANGEYYYVTEDADISAAGESTVAYKVTFNGIYENLAYDASAAKSLMTYACSLVAQRDLGVADESELALYGLDEPQSVVTLTKISDNSTVNIYVGAYSDSASSYYCKVDNSDHVYIISGAAGEMFTSEPNDMRISQFTVAVTTDTIETMTWKYMDDPEIYIYRELEDSVFNPYTKFFVGKPWSRHMPINGDAFAELVNGLTVLYINDHITPKLDGSEVNLADYGLDDPWGYYKLTGKDGAVQEFSFGDYSDEAEYYCYMLDHSDGHIYTVARNRVSFIEEFKAVDVTTPYIFNAHSDNIQSVKAEYDGKVSILEIFRDYLSEEEKKELEENGEDVIDFTTYKKLDGVSYDEFNMGRLYQCALVQIQRVDNNYEHEAEALLKMTITPFDIDEDPLVIEYYRIDENFCAAYINGVCDFVVSAKAVTGYIQAIDDVKAGITPGYKL